MIGDIENYHIERTSSTNNAKKFCEAICAFSNDMPGSGKNGYLILGAHDNGKLSGLRVDDKLYKTITAIRSDGNILPYPSMSVEKFSYDEGDLLVVEVVPHPFLLLSSKVKLGFVSVHEKILLPRRRREH